MKFRNDNWNVFLFHIISPSFVLLSAVLIIFGSKTSLLLYSIAGLLLFDFITNIFTLIATYNQIDLKPSYLVITNGLINKKSISIVYSNIFSIERIDNSFVFKPFSEICIRKIRPIDRNIIIHIKKGYMSDSKFNELEKEIRATITK
jgi:hypothetical protein